MNYFIPAGAPMVVCDPITKSSFDTKTKADSLVTFSVYKDWHDVPDVIDIGAFVMEQTGVCVAPNKHSIFVDGHILMFIPNEFVKVAGSWIQIESQD